MKKLIAALCISCASIGYVYAQSQEQNMMGMVKQKAMSASSQALEKVNETMHKNMMVKMTGNADVDFVKSMLAHHQGAVDMAKVELKYGKEPEAKKLAENIIAEQEKEIKQMQDWLKQHDQH